MKTDEYRKAGLPITRRRVELTFKQIDRRVKEPEKFWDLGAKPILQLAADSIGETGNLQRFSAKRHENLEPMRAIALRLENYKRQGAPAKMGSRDSGGFPEEISGGTANSPWCPP